MHKEVIRYLENAKEILRKAKIEDNRYKDIKHVREHSEQLILPY